MRQSKLIIIPLMVASFLLGCNANHSVIQHSTDVTEEESKYFVKFECYGGSHVQMQRVTAGGTVEKPVDPTRGNDTFSGWYIDEKFQSEYDFTKEVKGDLVLYAHWTNVKPQKYEFTFNGTNCTINAQTNFSTNVPIKTKTTFAIIPNPNYSLPTSITIDGSGKDSATYNKDTGVILINDITGDIEVTAEATTSATRTFTFTGENCTINGEAAFTKDQIEDGTRNVQFTIVPDENYVLPTEITVEEGEEDFVSYKNGTITISRMVSDFEISATAESTTEIVTINFNGVNCKAGLKEDGSDANSQIIFNRKTTSAEGFVIHLFPDSGCELPESVNVIFGDDSVTNDEDYVYDKANKKITINKVANTLIAMSAIKPEADMHTITFDANGGNYCTDVKGFNLEVEGDINLSYFLHSCCITPTLKDKVFGYYEIYEEGQLVEQVDYDYTITEDITLKAVYFNTKEPYDDLDKIETVLPDEGWSIIKAVAIYNPNPYTCFKMGATKTVTFNGQPHKVRIIDFSHDKLKDSPNQFAGITFEFANLLSNSSGSYSKYRWSGAGHNYDFPSYLLNENLNGGGEIEEKDSVYGRLPNSLKDKIEVVSKKFIWADSEEEDYKPKDYTCHLFPLSFIELCGQDIEDRTSHVISGEGTIYKYYEIHNDYEHDDWKKYDVGGHWHRYWLRSPNTENAWGPNPFAWVISEESIYGDAYPFIAEVDEGHGVAPCFCI